MAETAYFALGDMEHAAYLDVGETLPLGLQHKFGTHILQALAGLQGPVGLFYVLQPVDEPAVYVRELVNPVYIVA